MNTYELLKQELAYHGFLLIDEENCAFFNAEKQKRQVTLKVAVAILDREIEDNKKLFFKLWNDLQQLLYETPAPDYVASEKSINLLLASVHDLSRLLCCVDLEGPDFKEFKKSIAAFLNKDIRDLSRKQINKIPDYKIAIDWIHRLVYRLLYVKKLLQFAATGYKNIVQHPIKTAAGVSGPFANLDVPTQERTWSWGYEDDELFRGKDKDLRMQRRYRKGFENYNNDGRVGDGHMWRELRNEPYSWSDRKEESSYPSRTYWNT